MWSSLADAEGRKTLQSPQFLQIDHAVLAEGRVCKNKYKSPELLHLDHADLRSPPRRRKDTLHATYFPRVSCKMSHASFIVPVRSRNLLCTFSRAICCACSLAQLAACFLPWFSLFACSRATCSACTPVLLALCARFCHLLCMCSRVERRTEGNKESTTKQKNMVKVRHKYQKKNNTNN